MGVRTLLREHMRTKGRTYQTKGVKFVEEADGRALITDQMGLGKSWQAAAWCAIHQRRWKRRGGIVITVCPASVKYKWQNEWRIHAGLRSVVLEGEVTTDEEAKKRLKRAIKRAKKKARKEAKKRGTVVNLLKLRREVSRLRESHRASRKRQKALVRETVSRLKRHPIAVVNFDILPGWVAALATLSPQVLIVDECHYVKNLSARRTKACQKLSTLCPHVMGLSGTPIENKPAEFFSILNMVRPAEFPSYWKFGFEFCAPKRNKWSGNWEFSGASHLDRLRRRLKGIMIRRLRRHVLKELPPTTRVVVPISIDNRSEYEQAERDFLHWLQRKKGRLARDRAARAKAICQLRELKHLTAEGKMRTAVAWIKDWLDDNAGEKLVVFGIHRSIMGRLKEEFPDALVIDGSTNNKRKVVGGKETSDRQLVAEKFQSDKKSRLLFGQLKAAGVGIDLFAASNVLFLELGWTPGEHHQAEDRVARIGQTATKINAYYLVGKDTIEEHVLEMIDEKDKTVTRILDGKRTARMRLLDIYILKAGKRAA